MKKKSNSRISLVFFKIFNVRTWFDLERMKVFTAFVGNAFRRLFMMGVEAQIKPQNTATPNLTESFNTAKKSLNLSEADLLARQKALLRLSIFMITLALLIFCYSLYHFVQGTYRAALLSLVMMMIAVALSFRYHFWYYQIKSRKLGCSIKEWFRKGLLGEIE